MGLKVNIPGTRRNKRSLTLLLVAAVFLFSQSLALSHIHVDDELSTNCFACHHADNSSTIETSDQVFEATFSPEPLLPALDDQAPGASVTHDHRSRAPPANS